MKYTNNFNLPKALLNALVNDNYTGYKAGDKLPSGIDGAISVTGLLDSPYKKHLERLYHEELEQDVSDSVWLLLGKGVHAVLEAGAEDNDLFEERLSEVHSINGKNISLSGAFDYYDSNKKIIQDYKATSVYVRDNKERMHEYAMQLNIYAYLLRKQGFEVTGIENVMFYKDYSKVRQNAPAPVEVIKHKLYSNDEIEMFVKDRLELHFGTTPTSCTPAERWAKPDTYAVMKQGNKRAVRVFENISEAEELANTDSKYYVEKRQGTDGRCSDYCNCNKFCKYYQEKQRCLEI